MGTRPGGPDAPHQGARPPVQPRRAQIAVVGFGNAGRQHAAAIGVLVALRPAAVVETDPEAARRAVEAGLTVRPLPEVLADPAVAALAVCLPPGHRPPVLAAAIAAGKHLVVEKLPARSPAELREILDAAAGAGLFSTVMFQHRFALPGQLRVKAPERFADGIGHLLISRPRSDSHYREGWRAEPEAAVGGVSVHLGAHYIDLACQLLGEPVEVTALSRTEAVAGIDTELLGHVTFRSGARLTVTVTCRAAARFEQLTVLGRRDWVEVRAGATVGELDGRPLASAARPAGELRQDVYRELTEALRGGPAPDLSALARSTGVVAILDGLLGTPVGTTAPVAAPC
ncbi:Gfo/Idh/MocA family protein [Streptomyces sp. NBC_00078]|uniref:Gfo/Idh/MocA family protein n=1 Tax=unclassified Streptomyces TaxID=2593676 RepID=UPI00225C41E2|nr:Gfo/Idh/MocA family oxidoreductase [Streptomyces sp. NBC_00078]MCX5418127.1 Gfo/Idh/MocA family oxidoreductase [Streptomyces sp. NBC_00078]MCX5426067.1 Gfo/Idh/MocA family oxidoreductase [Streptomyces sp. NBC_00078]MCX5426164.1 Gfo/Idh/MocA family oxidoreductase [Streptomyces sp. NBC_00078]